MVNVGKRFLACVTAAVFSVALFGSCSQEGDNGKISVSFAQNTMSVEKYSQHSLEAEITGKFNGTISYSCSDNAIATITEDGLLTAVGVGSATITAQAGGTSAVMQLNVRTNTEEPILRVAGEILRIPVGQAFDLAPQVYYADSTVVARYSYEPNDDTVTVSGSEVTGRAVGEYSVTVKADYAGVSLSTAIAVSVVDGSYFFLDAQNLTLYSSDVFGEGLSTSTEVRVFKNISGDVVWESNNENIVKVNDGMITAISAGETTVTATLGGVTETIFVKVLKPSVLVAQSTDSEKSASSVAIDLTEYKAVLPNSADALSVNASGVQVNVARLVNGWLIADPKTIPLGEQTLKVESPDLIVYVPVICATLIIDNQDEFMQIKEIYFRGGATAKPENSDPLRDGYFILNADIDFDEVSFGVDPRGTNASIVTGGEEAPWRTQIGWYGVFDGRGHVIKHLKSAKRGLFGNIELQSVVKNVAFVDVALGSTAGTDDSNSGYLAETVVGTVDNVLIVVESIPGAPLSGKAGYCTTLYGEINNSVCIVTSGQNQTNSGSQPAVVVDRIDGNPIDPVIRGSMTNTFGISKGNLAAVNSVQYGIATIYRVLTSFAEFNAVCIPNGFADFWKISDESITFGTYKIDASELKSSIV